MVEKVVEETTKGDDWTKLISRALGKLNIAKDRLLEKYPFHAAVIGSAVTIPEPPSSCPTMAVTIRKHEDDGGYQVALIYGPDFVLKTPLPELVGVLLHEVHHVIFHHLLMKREDFPNRAALVAAEELTVNEYITEPLPKTDYLLKNFPDLPPHESTEERYHRLDKVMPVTTVTITLDDHGRWDVIDDKDGTMADAVKEMIKEAAEACEGKGLPKTLRETLVNKMVALGDDPGFLLEKVEKRHGDVADWESILRTYTGKCLDVMPTYSRPPRRFPDMVGILPGRIRRGGQPHILAALDTSGSVQPYMLSQMDRNLAKFAKRYKVTVAECGAIIHDVYPYKPLCGKEVMGRGDGNLCPPLEEEFLRKHKIDLVIFFTDGYERSPLLPPIVPVIWCIFPGGTKPTPWGQFIQL